ncbi:hypothetical protein JCM9152_1901 [Halalkalibacter hemicellulosilyticusJCM 9152]|uniref:Uncharacterized protein n=2 Tax=Halalkalibacter TaxID=2893056 RepID=W4QFR9_9BACI|nr:hypothetical protein JCM9152_1901 [Halalkalibacter hemicellulosilyticusJCM 9152]
MRMNETKHILALPFFMIFLLALLGVPRVIAHDLQLVEPGSFANSLLAIIPPLIWLAFVIWKGISPFKPLVYIGVFYGVLLGITHQILWGVAFETAPTLGGNLSDLPPLAHSLITRVFGFVSSVLTGTLLGVIVGFVGLFIYLIRNKTRK